MWVTGAGRGLDHHHRVCGRDPWLAQRSCILRLQARYTTFHRHPGPELRDEGIRVAGIYRGGMGTPFWDVQTYQGDRTKIMGPAKVAEMVLAVVSQSQGILVREVILFPTNEWH